MQKHSGRAVKTCWQRSNASHHFSVPLTLDWFVCCVSRGNDWPKQSVPRFLLCMLFFLWLKRQLRFCGILFWLHTILKKSACLLFNKLIVRFLFLFIQQYIYKRCCLEGWRFFAYVVFRKQRAIQQKKITGQCFSTEMNAACKHSVNLEQETKTIKIITYPLFPLASSIIN